MLKKIAVQAVLDERTRKKLITIAITILVVLLVIIMTVASVPTILINTFVGYFFNVDEVGGYILENEFDPNAVEDMEKVAIYQDTIIIIDQLNKDWIEEVKEENSDCDEFEIDYNYSLTWESLISIDSVLKKQDFEVVDPEKVTEVGLGFITKDVSFRTEEIEEERRYEVENEDGTISIETETKTIIIKICIITVDTKEFEDVLPEVGIVDEEDVLLATNIFETVGTMVSSFYIGLNLQDILNIAPNPDGYTPPIVLDDTARITSYFGYRNIDVEGASTYHKGVDIGAPIGTPVFTVADGTVTTVSNSFGTGGKAVVVNHENGAVSWYLHLNDFAVNVGDEVKQGDVVGFVGNTGVSSGPHLHFEFRVNNVPIDPLSIITGE